MLAAGEMTRGQIEVQTELAVDLPEVFGDRVQLQQVLLNLITNAVDAMSSITNRARVLLIRSERRDPASVAIAVRDSGVGLDPQKMENLFDAFYTTKPQGIGMGLSICRTIISSHGGHLSGVNNAGQGATFEFTLPAHEETSEKVEIATA
jgi:signal transduction histidine kinase